MNALNSIRQFFELFFELQDAPAGRRDELDELDPFEAPAQKFNTNGLLMVGGVDVLGNPPGVDNLYNSGRWD